MEQILTTKLFIPAIRPERVPRPHLLEQLNACAYMGCKLILISAPAGFGKTTLVSEWVQSMGKVNPTVTIAWLSLDESDNDLTRFLAYFIAALNQADGIETSIGRGSLSMLQFPQLPPTEAILTPLINEIAAIPDKILLVLDDYHLINTPAIHDALSFIIDKIPPQMHLVIATREDPHLPLSRLRARGQLTELRASDLRFTSSEAAEFLNRVMGLDLPAEDITALETRTEGWIAGLQLAALSMQGLDDISSLIKSFTGSNRHVLDYLVEEVLEQQSENVQAFLLQTSILDRLTGSLCDMVTGQKNSQAILELLERANLFIVSLDEERCWYRYHHLFADLLRQRLNLTQPDKVTSLHHQASEWFEQNGFIDEAIDHALDSEDFKRTAHLITRVADAVWARGRDAKLRHWLEELPDELVLSRPHLCIFQAWELFASGQQDAAERFLQAAELGYDPNSERVIETESNKQDHLTGISSLKVRGRAATIRAWMAAYRTDIPGIIQHSRQALEYLPEQDLNWRSAAAITLGDAYFLEGDYVASHRARVDAMNASEEAGNIYLFMNASAKLALTLKSQGQLFQVRRICQQRLRLANESGMSQTAVVGWLLSIWAEVLAEINDLDRAIELVTKGLNLTESGGDVVMRGWSYLCMTRILFSMGNMASAEEIVQKMNNIARESIVPIWIMNLNAAWQSRIWLAQNKLEDTSHWMREHELEPDIKPSYVGGLKYIALARILIALGRWKETTVVLQSMLDAAEVGGNITRMIEIMILQALGFQAAGDTAQAMTALERALTLAEPRGFYRIFADEGPSMATLLYETLDRGIAPAYVRRLLQAFSFDEPEKLDPSDNQSFEFDYIEPLSEREIEVLQLIAEGLTNPEIATRLFLSPHTVKTHTRNIYGKLSAHNRTEAISRGRLLGILLST